MRWRHRPGESPRSQRRGAEGATSPEPLRHQGPGGTSGSGACARRRRQRGTPATSIGQPAGRAVEEAPMKFAQRHIGPSEDDQAQMLKTIGYGSLDELTSAALPVGLAADRPLTLPQPLTQEQALAQPRPLARRNP